jgi:hypothetical protein
MKIVYETIDEIVKINESKNISKDAFINEIIETIYYKIQSFNILSEAEKKFWTKEKITDICKPFIISIINKIDTK